MSSGSRGLSHIFAFIGRIFFAIYFIVNGLHGAFSFNAIVQAMPSIEYANIWLIALTVLQLLGGVLIVIGWFTRFGAFLLFAAAVLMTWLECLLTPPMHAQTIPAVFASFMPFVDNIGFAGGTLYIMALGAGAASIDYFRCKKKCSEDAE